MKKRFLSQLIALLAFQHSFLAQTLTANECTPIFGDKVIVRFCGYIPQGSSGSGKTWDFSSATFTAVTSNTVVPPSTVMNGSLFPTSSYAESRANISPTYTASTFYRADSNGIERVGYYQVFEQLHGYLNPQRIMKFPFSLGSTFTDTFKDTLWYPQAFNTYTNSGTFTTTADGSGTLITPEGTFKNVLRTFTAESSTFVTVSNSNPAYTETYNWYMPGVHFPLLTTAKAATITGGAANTPIGLTYLFNPYGYTGIENNSPSVQINVYPNPAFDDLHFESELGAVEKVTIMNSIGQEVLTIETKELKDIDVSGVPAGLYTFIFDIQNENSFTRKIAIER